MRRRHTKFRLDLTSHLPVLMTGSTAAWALAFVALPGCSVITDGFSFVEPDAGPTTSDAGENRDADVGSVDASTDASPGDDAGADGGPEDGGLDAGPPAPPLDPLRRIATGWTHTCVLVEREVYCWGDNEHGQLGNGSTADSTTPTLVSGLPPDVMEISATGYFSCALTGSGRVYCWGQNDFGQLGDETTETRRAPVRAAPSIDDATRLAAGGDSVCALRSAGNVSCWGRGSGGALGNGELVDSVAPVSVIGLDELVLGISGSGTHFCVRQQDETTACWGWNRYSQLGQLYDPAEEIVSTPVEPRGLAGVLQVSAGGRHTCTRTSSSVACWGWNMFGQLGNGTGPDTHTPVIVGGLDSPAADLSAGGSHTCALLESETVYCWGGNDMGQLGLGDRMERGTPAEVSGFTAPVEQVSAGDFHTCAALSTGDIACWGGNFEGQLGTGTREDSLTPQIIAVGP